jgi:O-antigen/teichoic acid export membrane protein
MKIDQVMLGEMVGDSAVGIYATAVKISELWYFIPSAIAGSVFPKIVSSRENASEEVYRERMQAFYDAVALLSYLVIIPVTLSAEPLIKLIFGAEYAESASILQVHIWAFLFVALGTAQGKWLVTENFTKFSMLTAILGAFFNVSLNAFVIPTYAGLGAAWATLLAQAIANYFSLFLLRTLWPTVFQLSKALMVPLRIRSAFRGLKKVT